MSAQPMEIEDNKGLGNP